MYAILLCAGEGTRMNDSRTHKVCYEVAGVPSILRSVRNFQAAGVNRFVVVVGSRADKVMACLDGIDGVIYAYQAVRKGTGDAALRGLKALAGTGYEGGVLITAGDKIIAPEVISGLVDAYRASGKKAVFSVQPKAFNRSGGRIVLDESGALCGIVEHADSALLALNESPDKSEAALSAILERLGVGGRKRAKLMERAKRGGAPTVTLRGRAFASGDIEAGEYVNTATYVFDLKAVTEVLKTLQPDNAEGEIYLTDAVNAFAARSEAEIFPVAAQEKILSYSTMDELLKLHAFFEVPRRSLGLPFASEWIDRFNLFSPDTRSAFEEIYGPDPAFLDERRHALIALLGAFIGKYGDRALVIARAPGRVNLMGRHVEHRGGSINVMSFNREMLVAAAPREDDRVHIANTDPAFRDSAFSILEAVSSFDTDNWVDFIESEAVLKLLADTKGEWVNYVKAGVLRLQLRSKGRLLSGMDMMFSGDIPMAAGLSSSSSLVVASTEAAIALNGIDMELKEFINLCGEGEWFVGSRGGAGDHAAMKVGRRGRITHLHFMPFEIRESLPFPKDYRVVVVNSYVAAKKSAGAKDRFNLKVAEYEFGLMLAKKRFPQYAERLQYLRDLNPATLRVPQSRIYEILLEIPERMTPGELLAALPEQAERIARVQRSHAVPDCYEIRGTVLYGIAECLRAEKCIELLAAGDFAGLGRLMNVSHDGDRVWKDGAPFSFSVSDGRLRALIADLESGDADRVAAAQLWNQPGAYACSVPVIDELVDFLLTQDGVMGAELSGAGLGGCIITLVRRDCAEDLLAALKREYYDKNVLPMGAQPYFPVSGSMVFAK